MVPRKRGDDDSRRVLPWALLLSILSHAVLIPVLLWFILLHLAPEIRQQPETLSVASSTAVTISQKNHSVPQHHAKPLPVVQHQQLVAQPTPAPPPPHELAQRQPHAPPQPPQQQHKPSLGDQLAAQEQQFAHEAQTLHEQNNPLSVATESPVQTTIHRSYFDDPNNQKRIQGFMAYLSSVEQWYDGALSCHYVHYVTYFNGGGSEDGNIPWPVCYPRDHDLLSMRNTQRYLPVPFPQPGYVLPADTYITPWLKENVYDTRPH